MYLPEELLLKLDGVTDSKSSRAKELLDGYYSMINDLALLAIKEYIDKNPNDENFKRTINSAFTALMELKDGGKEINTSNEFPKEFFELLNQKIELYNTALIDEKIILMREDQIDEILSFLKVEQEDISTMSLDFREKVSNILLNSLNSKTYNSNDTISQNVTSETVNDNSPLPINLGGIITSSQTTNPSVESSPQTSNDQVA